MPSKVRAKSSARSSKAKKARSATRPAAKKAAKGPSPISAKAQYLDRFRKECATTIKVLRAYPADQGDFRPHPRSLSAREVAWRFVMEQSMLSRGLTDTLTFGSGGPPEAPASFSAIVEQFEREHRQVVALLERTPDAGFAKTLKFFSGPGTMAEYSKLDFAHFMLGDQIHHRGQLSVYLRLAGGKVPSIYGPSGDEPWR